MLDVLAILAGAIGVIAVQPVLLRAWPRLDRYGFPRRPSPPPTLADALRAAAAGLPVPPTSPADHPPDLPTLTHHTSTPTWTELAAGPEAPAKPKARSGVVHAKRAIIRLLQGQDPPPARESDTFTKVEHVLRDIDRELSVLAVQGDRPDDYARLAQVQAIPARDLFDVVKAATTRTERQTGQRMVDAAYDPATDTIQLVGADGTRYSVMACDTRR